MNQTLKTILSLTLICSISALLLAVTNFVTSPIIEANEAAAANEALLVVMPNGSGFEAVDLSTYELPASVKEVWKEANGGYVVKTETIGYGSGFVIMTGVDANGVVTGTTCLGSSETLGYEQTYGENLVNMTSETIDAVDTISGATKTTEAYKNSVKDALNTAIILGGGSVDIRTPEQILLENLNTALPSGEGAFTKWFKLIELNELSEVYSADNGAGYVFVNTEGEFIGVTAEDVQGLVAMSASIYHEMSGAITAMSATLTDVDLSGYENIPSHVVSVKKTDLGNYVFELKASGFGINGDSYYNPSGEHIKIMVSATASGVIIDCVTTYQSETEGIGSVCEDYEFSSQFNSKDETNYKEIDAISGATYTTNGYKTAIGKVFETIKILEGGAN